MVAPRLPQASAGTLCRHQAAGAGARQCGQVLAGDADHAVTCKKGRGIQRMHDVVAAITCQACRDAGLEARREIVVSGRDGSPRRTEGPPSAARRASTSSCGAPRRASGTSTSTAQRGMRPACAAAPGRPGRTARRLSRRPQRRNAATRSAVAWRAARPTWRPWATWAPSSASSSWSWRSWPRPGPMSLVSLPRDGFADGERSCRASCTKQLRAACMRQSKARVSRGPGPALPKHFFLNQTYALARQAASETERQRDRDRDKNTQVYYRVPGEVALRLSAHVFPEAGDDAARHPFAQVSKYDHFHGKAELCFVVGLLLFIARSKEMSTDSFRNFTEIHWNFTRCLPERRTGAPSKGDNHNSAFPHPVHKIRFWKFGSLTQADSGC